MRLLPLATALLCANGLFAASFSFTGSFSADNDLQVFAVTMSSSGVLNIRTWGYGGGVNGAGNTITEGGFAPAIAVFQDGTTQVAVDNLGGTVPTCNGRNIDSVTGFCLDAIVYDGSVPDLTLPAGTHLVVLSQQGNTALGDFADGFFYDALHGNDPSFTGTNNGVPGARFLDPGFGFLTPPDGQRTSNWALDISGDTVTTADNVPEPAAISMFLIGLASAAVLRRRK